MQVQGDQSVITPPPKVEMEFPSEEGNRIQNLYNEVFIRSSVQLYKSLKKEKIVMHNQEKKKKPIGNQT